MKARAKKPVVAQPDAIADLRDARCLLVAASEQFQALLLTAEDATAGPRQQATTASLRQDMLAASVEGIRCLHLLREALFRAEGKLAP